MAFAVLAHNLARWLVRLGLPDQLPARTTTERLRRRLFSLPGHRTSSARRQTLHLPERWPWQHLFLTALTRLRAVTWTRSPAWSWSGIRLAGPLHLRRVHREGGGEHR